MCVLFLRSPYSFNVDEDSLSTRFITVTRTFTSSIAKPSETIKDDQEGYRTSTPLFQAF